MSTAYFSLEHLASIRPCGPGTWGPDGGSIAFFWADRNGNINLWIVGARGGWPRRVTDATAALERAEGTDRRDVLGGPQWGPTGREFAITRRATSGSDQSIWIVNVGDGMCRELANRAGDDYRTPRWAPDGSRLASVRNRDGRDDIVVLEPRDGVARQLTYDRWDNTDPEWSPDSKRIAYISQRSDADLFDNCICVVPAIGGDSVQLTDADGANDRSPKWSPDGSRIAYVSNRDGADNVWSIGPDGSGMQRLTSGLNEKGDPRWSPDGSWILYTSFRDCDVDIMAVSRDGSASLEVVRGGVNQAPRWSPDGSHILYHRSCSDEPGDLWTKSWGGDSADAGSRVTNVASNSLDGIVFSFPSVISYESADGLPIQALLYRPTDVSDQPRPSIVYVRGGPNAVNTNGWLPQIQYLAQDGFTVIVPNYRGSTGYGRSFMEINRGVDPGHDIDDWLGAALYLRRLPELDPQNVGIMGRSYGGYATLLLLGLHPDVFKVGVAIAAPSNWVSCWEDAPIAWMRRLQHWLMGRPASQPELNRARSPVNYADRYAVPVLIIQGAADVAVPASQAYEMARRLGELGKPHEIHVYPGEDHAFSGPDAIIDSNRRIRAFLRANLVMRPAPGVVSDGKYADAAQTRGSAHVPAASSVERNTQLYERGPD